MATSPTQSLSSAATIGAERTLGDFAAVEEVVAYLCEVTEEWEDGGRPHRFNILEIP